MDSQGVCGLRWGCAAVCLLGLWVQIPPGEWMPVSCECCVLSGGGLCAGLITHCGVPKCDYEASIMRGPRSTRAVCTMEIYSDILGMLFPLPSTG